MSGFAVWFAAWAITLVALGWQARLLRTQPTLGLRTTVGTSRRVVGAALLLDTIVFWFASAAFEPWLAALVTLAAALLYTASSTLLVDLYLLDAVARRIRRGDTPGAARLARFAVSALGRHGPTLVLAHCGQALARTLALYGDLEGAALVLAEVERRPIPLDTAAWSVALDLAVYRIGLGRHAEARRTIALCTARWTPPTEAIRETLELLEARLDASTGHPDRALERAGGKVDEEWDFVRAHAYVAAGRPEEARQVLERIRLGEDGESKLKSVVSRRGPAAELAKALLEEKPAPYR